MAATPPSLLPGERIAGVALLLAASLAVVLVLPLYSLNHDASWYLVATAKFLDGAGLYSEILEINPPLAFYLTVVPVASARALGIDPTLSYFLHCAALGLLAGLWSLRIIARAGLAAGERRGLFLLVLAVLFVLPIAEFGQREHLTLLFAMPFVLAQMLRGEGRAPGIGEQVALGLFGALGFLLKPHFLAIPAIMGLARLLRERDAAVARDPAYLALAAAAIGYLLFIWGMHPTYLDRIVPLGVAVYASYGMPMAGVLVRPELAAVALLASLLLRDRGCSRPGLPVLLGATAGAGLAYLLQFKGWNYQVLPLAAFLLMSAGWWGVAAARQGRREPLGLALVLMITLMTLGPQLWRGPYESATTARFAPFVDREGRAILVLSTNVSAAFPFVNEVGGGWASRYSAHWLIPGATDRLAQGCAGDGASCAEARAIAAFARDTIITDLERFEPHLVYVDERPRKAYFRDPGFDHFEFLSQDPRFAPIRACYRKVGDALGYGVYQRRCGARP
ncbi:hypothetical protein [Sphingomicrobium astaxanthinifaciens]|uniref:hypothetical protein n=1 Tax=Sphingomicrobium astaxanthinifaciens TaxID=1227949 RepID=UPI001FCA760F|nr:hypothetical protein [Sphingomicrobium astaxanthinifaciens]MCJ7420250.1 hypothetical protein [Sphingomicrobium astaxanthinifaciens]